MLPLPAAARRLPWATTTAPTGTSPRRPARAAARSASRIQLRSASVAAASAGADLVAVPEADPFTLLVSLTALGALRVTLHIPPLGVAGASGVRRLALLHIGLADDHGLGHVLHGPAGLQVLVHLLAVHLGSDAERRRAEHQGPPEHQDSESHARLLARV